MSTTAEDKDEGGDKVTKHMLVETLWTECQRSVYLSIWAGGSQFTATIRFQDMS